MCLLFFFFLNDPATTEIYPLSLHDALPICDTLRVEYATTELDDAVSHFIVADDMVRIEKPHSRLLPNTPANVAFRLDRKSTRLNSSHLVISYAVFCLKKKKQSGIQLLIHRS